MLTRALDGGLAGVCGWVTGGEVYGCGKVRWALEQQQVGYVLTCERTEPVWALTDHGPAQLPACELLVGPGEAGWQRRSADDCVPDPDDLGILANADWVTYAPSGKGLLAWSKAVVGQLVQLASGLIVVNKTLQIPPS
jgi:hypothetical protein